MFPLKRVARFFILFVIFYGLFMAPWPGVKDAYGEYFRGGATILFSSFGEKDNIRFRPYQPKAGEHDERDTIVTFTNSQTGAVGTVRHSARLTGYIPTVVLISLILATPLPRSRKGWALLWGFLLVNAFVALRLGLVLLRDLSRDDPLCLFELSPFALKTLAWSIRAFVQSMGSYFGFPVLIWILVVFRRRDWPTIFATERN
ncbi:MAG: hypothetical protein KAV82_12265 [Phycisphaerae bacterium]|nr:hypothetical protein [Phycisphaerae bacterium]